MPLNLLSAFGIVGVSNGEGVRVGTGKYVMSDLPMQLFDILYID